MSLTPVSRMRFRVFLVASVLALGCAGAGAAGPQSKAPAQPPAAEAEKIKLPLPWKVGQVLKYETEKVKTKTAPGNREKSIATATVEVRTVEADAKGFAQEWRWRDAKEDIVEGDKSMSEAMAKASRQIEARDLPLVIEMDPDGSYRRSRNIDEIAKVFREVMRPVIGELIAKGVRDASVGLDDAKRKEALDKVPAQTEAFLDRVTSSALLEAIMTREIQGILNYSGMELEDDQAYELETSLPNPTGAPPFPAKLTFGLYVEEDEPEDVYLEWRMAIDESKAAAVAFETAERLFGRKLTDAERKDLPVKMSITDEGFIVFERATGIPELFQNVRTTKLGEQANYERDRMRLQGTEHEHEWVDENPQDTEPTLSSAERDAQLCADEGADVVAAIAACSRILERGDLDAKQRARWHAARAGHRVRSAQYAQAIADFDKAIAAQPQDHRPYVGRANAQLQSGNHDATLADAAKAAALQPTSVEAQLLQGSAHEARKDYVRAAAHFGEAIARAPTDPRGHDARCWTRALAGDLEGAKADCDRALVLAPDSGNTFNSRGYVHFRAARFADAVRDYDAAIAVRQDVASSWYIRGLAKRALGDAKGADADIAKGLSLDPKVAERYAGYGVK
jgi:tetratricopeptide (TPR) repeat protein